MKTIASGYHTPALNSRLFSRERGRRLRAGSTARAGRRAGRLRAHATREARRSHTRDGIPDGTSVAESSRGVLLSVLSPRVSADPHRVLRRLGKRPRDLTVAWALAPEGIQGIAYRVAGTQASALVDAYAGGTGRTLNARTIQVSGWQVTMIEGRLPQHGFLCACGDVLYATNSYHVDGSELDELIAKLPGRGPPRAGARTASAGRPGQREARPGGVQRRRLAESCSGGNAPARGRGRRQCASRRATAPASALAVAWGTAPDGPKVVAYQVTGIEGERLLRSFIRSVKGIRASKRRIAGRDVTIATTGVRGRLGYFCVHGDVLFVAGSTHLAQGEVDELLSKLPHRANRACSRRRAGRRRTARPVAPFSCRRSNGHVS